MAFTVRGFGAMHYGKRDFRADGSFVTTLWIVGFYLPLVPIRSKRIAPTGDVKYYGIRPRQVFVVHEKMKPHLTQVLSTYAWFAAEVAICVTAEVKKLPWLAFPAVALLGVPWLLRKRAVDRMKAEVLRQQMGFAPEISE